jgi:aminoglycoside phosphotransferase (APT) family kinase protein
LLHTDWNNANVLIGEQTWLVDWGWATRGAPWLDAAYWIIWLIAAGHKPAAAEGHAAQVPAFSTAPVDAVTTFARVRNANGVSGVFG